MIMKKDMNVILNISAHYLWILLDLIIAITFLYWIMKFILIINYSIINGINFVMFDQHWVMLWLFVSSFYQSIYFNYTIINDYSIIMDKNKNESNIKKFTIIIDCLMNRAILVVYNDTNMKSFLCNTVETNKMIISCNELWIFLPSTLSFVSNNIKQYY